MDSMAVGDMMLSEMDKSFHMCALEREIHEGQELHEVQPIELVIEQPKKSLYFFSEQKPLTQSRVLLVNKHWDERQIKLRIFKLMRPLIQAPDISDKIKKSKPKSDDAILELEY